MTVSATEGFGVTAAAPQATASASPETIQADKDLFLKLMIAQLRNQSPMNPMDSSEFVAQTAQFTTLEKLTEVAESSAQAYAAQMAFGASTLAGKEVTYLDAEGAEHTGTVDSVRFAGTGPVLTINGTEVALTSVVGVVASDESTETETANDTEAGSTETGTSSTPATT